MQLIRSNEELIRRQPAPNAPTVRILAGGEPGGPDVGVVLVVVPAGAAMPEHDHNGSDVVLVLQAGSIEISGGGTTITVAAGDTAVVGKDERVSLRNPGETDAEIIVAAGPPMFVTAIRSWPEPSGD